MEKFNMYNEDSKTFSDSDSAESENDLLFNFLFTHHNSNFVNGRLDSLDPSMSLK